MSTARRETLAVDLSAFRADVKALKRELDELRGPEDLAHLRSVIGLTQVATVVGWALAPFAVNPVSILFLAFARSIRWTCVAHHISHKGYDRVPNQPEGLTSQGFAKGWRRWIDWADVLEPDAWDREHNQLHHHRLGEIYDPDVVERNAAEMLQPGWLPMPVRYVAVFFVASVWKWLVFAPSNRRELVDSRDGHRLPPERDPHMDMHVLMPWNKYGREIWATSYLPYAGLVFGLLPGIFLVFGWEYAVAALVNSLLAEWLTNLHTFLVVATNHAGQDVPRFEGKARGKGEFYVRQITGSVNFRTGGLANDLFHGWLNYQIEHHVWPDLTMRQYAIAQPRLQAICKAHGVPYVQESVWIRLVELAHVMVGARQAPVLEIVDVSAAAAK